MWTLLYVKTKVNVKTCLSTQTIYEENNAYLSRVLVFYPCADIWVKCEVWSKIFKVFCAEDKYRDEKIFYKLQHTKVIWGRFKAVHCNLDQGFSKQGVQPIVAFFII